MKRCLLTTAVCFFLTFSALAQSAAEEPASREDIQRYLDAMHSREMMRQMGDAMLKPLHKMVHEEYLKGKDKLPADFESRMDREMEDSFQKMPWDEMLEASVPVYQKYLTKRDVDSLVVFYSSPTGKKMLAQMPAMMSDSMEVMMPIMQRYIKTMQYNMQEQVAEMLHQAPGEQHRRMVVIEPTPATKN
jgi:hypothetical protein